MDTTHQKVNVGKWILLALGLIAILGLMIFVHGTTKKAAENPATITNPQ